MDEKVWRVQQSTVWMPGCYSEGLQEAGEMGNQEIYFKGKRKVPYLEENSPMQQYRVWIDWLESSLAEKDKQSHGWQQVEDESACAPAAKASTTAYWGVPAKVQSGRQRKWFFSSLLYLLVYIQSIISIFGLLNTRRMPSGWNKSSGGLQRLEVGAHHRKNCVLLWILKGGSKS